MDLLGQKKIPEMAAASFQKTSTKNSESDLEIEWMLEFDVDKKGLLRVMAKKSYLYN